MLHGNYDVIVLGVGGMGAAAAYELARRGRRVLGLEQFTLGHDRGSSHGRMRAIRRAYFEHPDYVPLARRAYERWYDLEQVSGRRLLTECPMLYVGPRDGKLVSGVRTAASQHALPLTDLGAEGLRRTYPQFRFDDAADAVLEPGAGFLRVEDCVLAYAQAAQLLRADIRENEPVVGWETSGAGVVVHTQRHRFAAQRLVVTAGPWAGRLLHGLKIPLTVMRQVQAWFAVPDPSRLRRDLFPIYVADTTRGVFYGMPVVDDLGHKCARHYGGAVTDDVGKLDRTVSAADEADIRAFLAAHLPVGDGPLRRAGVCPYTMTPDTDFVIDVHPEHPAVSLAAGFSGHGFKFASVVGEILADLAEDGRTDLPVRRFSATRRF